MKRGILSLVVLAWAMAVHGAQWPVITSFSRNGILVCTNLQPGTVANVERSSSLFGPWQTNWAGLNAVTVNSNGSIAVNVASNGSIAAGVPMFYRVLGVSATPAVPFPVTGNPNGHDSVPAEASAEDISTPDHVIGTGTPESCTADAFINAVALGGKITFNGGTNPFTIALNRPAKVFNNKPDIVIDGGGLVTLSGAGATRILYMNTCDSAQVWTTPHCDNQDHPHLAVQNLTFINGNSKNISNTGEGGGGGAIWVSGGRFKIVNCRFLSNVCADQGPDVGGAAVRVFSQYQGLPVYVVNSTFGGNPAYGGSGSNGGGISSIGVSWAIYNSVFSYNHAIGSGGNPAQTGTPGGGSGGAIYMDGNTIKLSLYGTLIEENYVNAYGSAIFLVSNNHDGTLHVENSIIHNNHGGSWYFLPGISGFSDTKQEIINSTIQ